MTTSPKARIESAPRAGYTSMVGSPDPQDHSFGRAKRLTIAWTQAEPPGFPCWESAMPLAAQRPTTLTMLRHSTSVPSSVASRALTLYSYTPSSSLKGIARMR